MQIVAKNPDLSKPEGALPSDPREQAYLPSEDPLEVLDGHEAIRRLGVRFGYARVGTWVRSLAAIAGEGVETREPAHERACAYGYDAREGY